MNRYRNRKKGVTFLEVAVVVAIMGIIISIIGPILRYYYKAGETYRFGIKDEGEQSGAYYKLEQIVSSIVLSQLDEDKKVKNTVGVGVLDLVNNTDFVSSANNKLSTVKGYVNLGQTTGNTAAKNAVFFETPVYIYNAPGGESLGQGFHYFRFANKGDGLKLYYNTTLNDDGKAKYLGSSDTKVFEDGEDGIFPSGVSKTVLIYGSFRETVAGTVMKMEYKETENSKVTRTVEKLFLKRGEI